MTPHEFIKKWSGTKLKERSAAQEHFLDLCRLLDEPTPADVDPSGLDFAFEVGATKTTGGRGFADVFKRGHFGWEYKGTHANLDTAFAQLQRYAVALDNPPLLIVSDIGTTIRIHTNWTNSVSKTYEVAIAALEDADKRQWLKDAFNDPERLRPKKTRQQLTEEVAGEFAELAKLLRSRGHKPEEVAHFINRLVFCMFAEDVKLLPGAMFTRMIERAIEEPSEFEGFARDLFVAMKSGGRIGFEKVAWFNGGLFDDDLVFALTKDEIKIVHRAAVQYWGDIDPSILGTLFERGLDPDKRSQLGAHYTDRDKIMMIINPVIVEPLAAEWEAAKSEIEGLLIKAEDAEAIAKTAGGRSGSSRKGRATSARNDAQAVLDRYLHRLADYRVLDPACGSGNFLYLALRALKDLEHRAQVEAEALGLPRRFPSIGPEVVKGIEINPYAAELARVSVWIGEIQWMLKNGFAASMNPILKPLETIECRDALLTESYSRAHWPSADAIIGNPPFLGGSKMLFELGKEYVEALRIASAGDVPGGADFVVYWFAKAWEQLRRRSHVRAGFVSTNSIRGGANREVLTRIVKGGRIFHAFADEPWTVDGAAVRVSLICFSSEKLGASVLEGTPVGEIQSDIKAGLGFDLGDAVRLDTNKDICVRGVETGGPFQIDRQTFLKLIDQPTNPNGYNNDRVLRRIFNGNDLLKRQPERYMIDFSEFARQADAAMFEKPYEHLERAYQSYSSNRKRRVVIREHWWTHRRSGAALRKATNNLKRMIVTEPPRVSRRPQFLRGWGHDDEDDIEEIFTGGPRTGSPNG
ncbi:class I SAM-dependent DNA methyltransferase, partial [Aurantimonas sp. C2-4-R8]|nr:DNA methyltransferase [Aurantimonas sp. C2-4-R8]